MPVIDVLSRNDQNAPAVVPKLQSPPETTGFFQNVGAGYRGAVAGPHSTRNARAIYESRHYDQIIQALSAEGEHATDMIESPVRADSPFYHPVEGEQRLPDGRVMIPVARSFANPFSEGPSLTRDVNPLMNFYGGGDPHEINNITAAVGRVRQRKPDFLPWFKGPESVDALANQQRATEADQAGQATSRATTLGKVGAFIGGMAGSVSSGDPENFAGGFTSSVGEAAGKSVARQVVRHATEGAAINTAAGIIAVPGQEADAQAQGLAPSTAGQIAERIGENAAVGAIFGTAHVLAPQATALGGKAVSSVAGKVAESLPAAVRDPIVAASIRAGTVKDRGLLYEFQRAHSPYSISDTSTPTEKAAAHVLVRDVETQEQSPLQPQHAGDNNNRLSAIAASIGADLPPPGVPTPAPIQVPTVRDQTEGATSPRRPASFAEGINAAEGSTRNPRSSADGYGNFIDKTWLSVAPHVADTAGMSRDQILALRHDKTVAMKATDYYAAQNASYLRARGIEDSPGNLSLAHFLGPEGAEKLLKAGPSTPVESLLSAEVVHANREVLQGKSADQVIAWAHKRIGAAVDQPPARPDAVPGEGFDYSSPAPYTVEMLRPNEVRTDAAAMQYKSGGDQSGVTDALKGVEVWNPLLSQQILAWEPLEGGRVVVDGHQRVALAKRLSDQGQDIQLPAVTVREADGITARDARVLGALRNIANGTGTLVDNAKVLRDVPDAAAMLPQSGPLARDSMGLAQLSHEAFGAAANEVVDPRIAAQVGLNAAGHPEAHMPILGLLAKERISDPREAAAITRQALADGFGTPQAEQLSMLGDQPQQSLYAPIARISAAAAKRLRQEKRTFSTLRENAAKIEAEGNVLDRAANASKVLSNDEALAILERTSHRAGPVRDALIRAARAELSGARRADATDQFLRELGGIDLRAAAGEGTADGGAGGPSLSEGRDFSAQAADGDFSAGGEPSLFARAITARDNAEKFSDPVGPEAQKQTALLEHDLRQDAGEPRKAPESASEGKAQPDTAKAPKPAENASSAAAEGVDPSLHLFDLPETGFRLSEEGNTVSIKEALDQADSDEAAAKALRDCL
jgi:hypothetical protein